MMSDGTKNILLSLFTFIFFLCSIELVCLLINRCNGVKLRYLYRRPLTHEALHSGNLFSALDPLLGYTYSNSSSEIEAAKKQAVFSEGYVFYGVSENDVNKRTFQRPVILTLGGSTTEPLKTENSWPEELASLMKANNINGTIINGGIGGYSSNQELIKILRDIPELSPDTVVTYHGVNEVAWADQDYPLSSKYLYSLLDSMINESRTSRFFPNTMHILTPLLSKKEALAVTEINRGVRSTNSPAQQLVKNTRLMTAALKEFGITHISILQPYALTGKYGQLLQHKYPDFYQSVLKRDITFPMYEELLNMQKKRQLPMIDFTQVFDYIPESYGNIYRDRCHLTVPGNKFLAQKIFEELQEQKIIPAQQLILQ